MTNFDKWKEELTPEEFVDILQRDWDTSNSDEFIEWANSEAEEDKNEQPRKD